MTPAAVTAAARPCCRDLRCPRCASNQLRARYWPFVRDGLVFDRSRLACRCGHVWFEEPEQQTLIALPEASR